MKQLILTFGLIFSSFVLLSASASKTTNDTSGLLVKTIDFTCGFYPVYENGSQSGIVWLYCNGYGKVVRTEYVELNIQ